MQKRYSITEYHPATLCTDVFSFLYGEFDSGLIENVIYEWFRVCYSLQAQASISFSRNKGDHIYEIYDGFFIKHYMTTVTEATGHMNMKGLLLYQPTTSSSSSLSTASTVDSS